MSLPTSLLSYPDCLKFMDRALEFTEGARIRMDSEAAAIHFRMRCQQARSLDRQGNLKVYPTSHFMHGRSQYDVMTFRLRQEDEVWYVYAERADLTEPGQIEGLGEAVEAPTPALPSAPQPIFDLDYDAPEEPKQLTFRRKL